jgi:hypothetical protein
MDVHEKLENFLRDLIVEFLLDYDGWILVNRLAPKLESRLPSIHPISLTRLHKCHKKNHNSFAV